MPSPATRSPNSPPQPALLTTNEKVALEHALGDSLAGRRAAVIVKHVGLNACADPLVHATAQGLRAGVVVVVGDDVRPVDRTLQGTPATTGRLHRFRCWSRTVKCSRHDRGGV